MINLIPHIGYEHVRKERRYRIFAVCAFLFSAVFIVCAIARIPTYILIRAQVQGFMREIQAQDEKVASVKQFEGEIERTHAILSQLKNATATIPASQAIQAVEAIATEGIRFKGFGVNEPDKKGVTTMHVQGTADTRIELAQFKSALEKSTLFEKAEIPLSDLAREQNLSFSVAITLKPVK
jgi:uncharacterized membrane protein YciS (DUF1049 family)